MQVATDMIVRWK